MFNHSFNDLLGTQSICKPDGAWKWSTIDQKRSPAISLRAGGWNIELLRSWLQILLTQGIWQIDWSATVKIMDSKYVDRHRVKYQGETTIFDNLLASFSQR